MAKLPVAPPDIRAPGGLHSNWCDRRGECLQAVWRRGPIAGDCTVDPVPWRCGRGPARFHRLGGDGSAQGIGPALGICEEVGQPGVRPVWPRVDQIGGGRRRAREARSAAARACRSWLSASRPGGGPGAGAGEGQDGESGGGAGGPHGRRGRGSRVGGMCIEERPGWHHRAERASGEGTTPTQRTPCRPAGAARMCLSAARGWGIGWVLHPKR